MDFAPIRATPGRRPLRPAARPDAAWIGHGAPTSARDQRLGVHPAERVGPVIPVRDAPVANNALAAPRFRRGQDAISSIAAGCTFAAVITLRLISF